MLAATAALFWFARRDLASRAASLSAPPVPPAETRELEQLCATLEALVTELARRLERLERQIAAVRASALRRQDDAEVRPSAVSDPILPDPVPPPRWEPPGVPTLGEQALRDLSLRSRVGSEPGAGPFGEAGGGTGPAKPPEAEPDPRHASLYALVESGVTDPVEIARQTGLGRGEVDLILSLRARRAL